MHPVRVHLLRRLRRQTFSSSSRPSVNGLVITSQTHKFQNSDGSIVSGGIVQQMSIEYVLCIPF